MMIKRVFGNLENAFSLEQHSICIKTQGIMRGTKSILLSFAKKGSNREGMVAHREARRGKIFA